MELGIETAGAKVEPVIIPEILSMSSEYSDEMMESKTETVKQEILKKEPSPPSNNEPRRRSTRAARVVEKIRVIPVKRLQRKRSKKKQPERPQRKILGADDSEIIRCVIARWL